MKAGLSNTLRSGRLFWGMARHDFRVRYAGSYFGTLWGVLQPVATVLIFWFVFQVGFGAKPVDGVPYVLWLAAGLIPWFFFAEAWTGSTHSLVEYGYLVKKMVFHVEWLPALKIISSGFMHFIFTALVFVMLALYGIPLRWTVLQLAYYTPCLILFVWTLSRITSSIQPFFKDQTQLLAIGLQFGMWLTPILWSESVIPDAYRWVFVFNPVYYVISGYRDALLGQAWFWEHGCETLVFWGILLALGGGGRVIFSRLEPHFADVL